MADPEKIDRDFEWLDQARPVGLVVSRTVLKDLNLPPEIQSQADTALAASYINLEKDKPALSDAWGFFEHVLRWPRGHVVGTPNSTAVPDALRISLPDQQTLLEPSWAVLDQENGSKPMLLLRIEVQGIGPDQRGALDGWPATPHHRFERLLRETGAERGVLITDEELRLIHAPRGETSCWIIWPLRSLNSVAGRPLLGGLKLMLGRARLFTGPREQRLPAILAQSREAQAKVSGSLSQQVLGALYELLRGLRAADNALVDDLARKTPHKLYEGLLTVLMRLVFILYAEDRDLLPSVTEGRLRDLYLDNYSVRGLHARLLADRARYPDAMDERQGGWGQLLALFRLIHGGHPSGWIKGRGGKLFDPDQFPFLEGRQTRGDAPRVLKITDGTLLRILDGLVMLKGERLSYRTLDVEQIGSVYETVMGFTVECTEGPSIAIKAGKNNRTPVFLSLEKLLGQKPGDRIKFVKENTERAPSDRQEKALKAAMSVDDLLAALESIVDERACPRKVLVPKGIPVLQPTDERRGTGSHYTPRTLTEPIVRQALEPVFLRLKDDATPEEVLDIKVCDPAMGSGAFLVEACRALAQRLQKAWEHHPGKRPAIPPDEDEDLHARRLVAQRCIYGVDKNPMATDLARLSLWLATLARDHEFTFLDHALKSGDSLVGLTRAQIADLTWGDAAQGKPLLRTLVNDAIGGAEKGRSVIRLAPDDVTLAIQEVRNREVENRLDLVRQLGDAIVATYFSAANDRARKSALERFLADFLGGITPNWDIVIQLQSSLRATEHPLRPFHWEVEFPEVFNRMRSGFDCILGNPPFIGGKSISSQNGEGYRDWLAHAHEGASRNVDLCGHFYRRAYDLLHQGGGFGLIATNTISQGDTREGGLREILKDGGTIFRATRRLKWPGEAAVVVSTAHIGKGKLPSAIPILIDGRLASRISAYLVNGTNDESPAVLGSNEARAFQGAIVLGMGFTFDDAAADKGVATPIQTMEELIQKDPRNAERIHPYMGGEELNNSPRVTHYRFVIDFEDYPLRRDPDLPAWAASTSEEREEMLKSGIVPRDYNGPVAADWPDLLKIVDEKVRPERLKSDNKAVRAYPWWKHWRPRPDLENAISNLKRVYALSRVSPMQCVTQVDAEKTFADSCVVFAYSGYAPLAVLQSRVHEVWARVFSSSMKDDLRYTPSDCFQTFPFPAGFETNPQFEAIGRAYHAHRSELMVAANQGMTPSYNRFHDPDCTDPAIQRLRALHADMDRSVLLAYGWDDLAAEASAIFLDEANETEFAYQKRLFWPASFRDRLLARLLDLNRARAADELADAASAASQAGPAVRGPKRRGAQQLGLDLGGTKQFDFDLGD